MAFSFTKAKSSYDKVIGGANLGFEIVCGTGSLGASYTTGGESVTAALLGFTGGTVHCVLIGGATSDGERTLTYDTVNDKIIAFDAFDTEESAAVDLSAAAHDFNLIAIVSPA